MPIRGTRALLTAAMNGALAKCDFRRDPNVGVDVPMACPGVDAGLLGPRGTWADPAADDRQVLGLVQRFADNFAQHVPHIDDDAKAPAMS